MSQRPVLSAPEVHGCHFLAPPTYAKQQTEQGGEKGALGAGQCLAGAATAQDDSESTKAHQAPRRSLKMALTGQQDAQHGELHLDGHAVQGQVRDSGQGMCCTR